MKDKLVKRRNSVNWKQVIDYLEDPVIEGRFWLLKNTCKKMSDNRLAYLALRHYFDKKILDYYRFTKDVRALVVFSPSD